MPRRPKPLTDAQKPKAQALRTAIQHAITRSRQREAEIRRLVQAEAHEDNLAAWKLAWELINDQASPTLLADITGVSRATLYSYAGRYEEFMGGRDLIPKAEAQRQPWEIEADGEEYVVTHPDLGTWRAVFEEDDSLTIWEEGKVYRPINREHPDRSEGEWTAEMELLYLPLTTLASRDPEPFAAQSAPVADETEDALSFLDEGESSSDEA